MLVAKTRMSPNWWSLPLLLPLLCGLFQPAQALDLYFGAHAIPDSVQRRSDTLDLTPGPWGDSYVTTLFDLKFDHPQLSWSLLLAEEIFIKGRLLSVRPGIGVARVVNRLRYVTSFDSFQRFSQSYAEHNHISMNHDLTVSWLDLHLPLELALHIPVGFWGEDPLLSRGPILSAGAAVHYPYDTRFAGKRRVILASSGAAGSWDEDYIEEVDELSPAGFRKPEYGVICGLQFRGDRWGVLAQYERLLKQGSFSLDDNDIQYYRNRVTILLGMRIL